MAPKSKVDVAEVARVLGMKQSEIVEALDSPGGTVVRTADGQSYIIVSEDDPQYVAKTNGVMWLTPPPSVVGGAVEPYKGSFPVYDQPAAVEVEGD